MKVFCIAIVAVLLCGCDQTPKNSHPAATGAFGWVFGEKLPDQNETFIDEDGLHVYSYETNGFFNKIQVTVNENRQICMITGSADFNKAGPFDIQNLVDELSKKYGLDDKADSSLARMWAFGSDNEVHLTVFNGTITLLYRYDKLLDPLQQKLNEQKNQQFKQSILSLIHI